MSKGSKRRPEDQKKIEENWPFKKEDKRVKNYRGQMAAYVDEFLKEEKENESPPNG